MTSLLQHMYTNKTGATNAIRVVVRDAACSSLDKRSSLDKPLRHMRTTLSEERLLALLVSWQTLLCHRHTLRLRKIDLGSVDLSVEEERVGPQDQRCQEEDDCESNRSASTSRDADCGAGNAGAGPGQTGKDVLDVVATRGVRVEVVGACIQVSLALSRVVIGVCAEFRNLGVLVVVV